MKQILLLINISILTLFLTACDSSSSTATEVKSVTNTTNSTKMIQSTSTFNLSSTTGEHFSLELFNDVLLSKQLQNKIVLINFWAPWCPPCVKEIPALVKIQEKYKQDLIILGVLFDKNPKIDELNTFMKENKVNFPVTIGGDNFKLATAINNIQQIPESFLFNQDGILVKKFIGAVNEEKLEAFILQMK